MKIIDLKSVILIILKRWWIIVTAVLVFSAAAVVLSEFFIEPVYQSNTTLYIGKEVKDGGATNLDYYDLLLGSQLVKDYRELVNSRLVANQVLKDLKLDYISAETFSGKLSVDSKNDTRVIQISVTDTAPMMAKDIANKVADVFMEKVVDIMHVENVEVIDRAEVPKRPIKPNKIMNTAIAFVLGSILGLGIVFIIEFMDNTVKTAEDIKEFLDLPVIGTIPVFPRKFEGISNPSDSMVIITHEQPRSSIAEAYRMLRTNVLFSSIDKPLKSLVVTSSSNNEGKTTTIVNLAVTFSQQGNKVLLIDGDLRKPQIHHIFGFENNNGLTNFLSAKDDYRKYIKTSKIEKLDVLVCGAIPPNPSELLMSNAMRQFIHQLRDDYDIVLIDAPPVGMVTDAAITSTMVDGTILVAASGTVAVDALARAKELLNKVNANIIGVVLSKLDRNSSENYYYQYCYEEKGNHKKKHKRRHGTVASGVQPDHCVS